MLGGVHLCQGLLGAGMVVHYSNPRTRGAEAEGWLCSRSKPKT